MTITSDVAPKLPSVKGDRVQLQQVLLNLIMNGLEAMEDTPTEQRKLTIRLTAENGNVIVTLRDTGPGIPDDMLEKIFTPFFTSKRTGFGMGLAISRSIMEAHGGRIWPETHPAGGATLRFGLPVAK